MRFTAPVTFLVGDNGSGKSTLVEAIAEGFKLDAYGGRLAAKRGRPNPQRTPLGDVLTLETTAAGSRMLGGPRSHKHGFFLRAETAFNLTENLGGVPGYWDADTASMSHGEGFLTIFSEMMSKPGFYVMDERDHADERGADNESVAAPRSPRGAKRRHTSLYLVTDNGDENAG
nr:AAA family ATPase [Actinopolyspora biskrensis]